MCMVLSTNGNKNNLKSKWLISYLITCKMNEKPATNFRHFFLVNWKLCLYGKVEFENTLQQKIKMMT